MARIKHTKTELKTQRQALARYERFLPMLQLKKQQLQAEIQAIDLKLAEAAAREKRVRDGLREWVRLFSDAGNAQNPLSDLVRLREIATTTGNIAGVNIPVLADVRIAGVPPDLFAAPAWHDEAMDVLEQLIRFRAERGILLTQRSLIADELRVTAQRVNLFDKVKIPECRENIRVIKIFLGDEQTAGVARAKIAKGRAEVAEAVEQAA